MIVGNRAISQLSVWNIGSGVALSVHEIVQIAALEYTKRDKHVGYSFSFSNENRPYDPKILLPDISKLEMIGFIPQILPKFGLASYFGQADNSD